ncbi:MAG TPA: helix-turn-helix domain-containing protein [Caulobacteraceae bacterium]|jgi:predicted DNA-binding transcriptional regulator AlpA
MNVAAMESAPKPDAPGHRDDKIAEPPPRILAESRADYRLTAHEVAERLGFTKKTVFNWRYKNTGPRSFKIGGRIFFLKSEVDAWEKSQEKGGKS